MKTHEIDQGSREWVYARLARPSASRFGSIMTPARLQYSKGAGTYIAELMVEQITGLPLTKDDGETPYTRRGVEIEDEARRWYGLHRDTIVQRVGLVEISYDGESFVGSPDGLVGDNGGLEIKCRGAEHHMRRLLGYEPTADMAQVQGYLWLTGRAWWDVLAYHPTLPKRLDRVYPDPLWREAWPKALDSFLRDLRAARAAFAGITDDVIEDDNLRALLLASLKSGVAADPDALDEDGIDAYREELAQAQAAGILDGADVGQALNDVVNGEWESVKGMRSYVTRHLAELRERTRRT